MLSFGTGVTRIRITKTAALFHGTKGKATVFAKTARTVSVVFESGLTVKNTYRSKHDRFYISDF